MLAATPPSASTPPSPATATPARTYKGTNFDGAGIADQRPARRKDRTAGADHRVIDPGDDPVYRHWLASFKTI
jgi:hypothetical protein